MALLILRREVLLLLLDQGRLRSLVLVSRVIPKLGHLGVLRARKYRHQVALHQLTAYEG